MAHEQSETIQLPSGKWVNVYGKKTPKAGLRLPDDKEYESLEEAEDAARKRSRGFGHKKAEAPPLIFDT